MINNFDKLLESHNSNSVRLILSALDHALASVQPGILVRQSVKLGDKLRVKDINGTVKSLRLSGDLYVVGAGKAVARMADSLCEILGRKIIRGAITVPYGEKKSIRPEFRSTISVTEAAHPVPDGNGIRGSEKIVETLSQASANDLVIVLISGGGSALLPLPSPGLKLADKQWITDRLLRSGATIRQVNIVRKHLSAIKGGQLPRYANEAQVVSLVLSDVIGDDLASIASGPTFPDSSTFSDALSIVRKYRIAGRASRAAIHLINGTQGKVGETPKPGDPCFNRVRNVIIGNNTVACLAAARYLRRAGIRTSYLGSNFDGEAKQFGMFLARLATDLGGQENRVSVILGGETTVTMKNAHGMGGRNQEAALACAMGIKGRAAVGCMGTDGIDGNSDAAGAVVSRSQLLSASKKRINLQRYLDRHDSYHALNAVDSLIFTGLTGTNVNDVSIVCAAD